MFLSPTSNSPSSNPVKKKSSQPFTSGLISPFLSARKKLRIFSSTHKEALLRKMSWEEEEKTLMMRRDKKRQRGELIVTSWPGQRLVKSLPTKLSNLRFPTATLVSMEPLSAQMCCSNPPKLALSTSLNLISSSSASKTSRLFGSNV